MNRRERGLDALRLCLRRSIGNGFIGPSFERPDLEALIRSEAAENALSELPAKASEFSYSEPIEASEKMIAERRNGAKAHILSEYFGIPLSEDDEISDDLAWASVSFREKPFFAASFEKSERLLYSELEKGAPKALRPVLEVLLSTKAGVADDASPLPWGVLRHLFLSSAQMNDPILSKALCSAMGDPDPAGLLSADIRYAAPISLMLSKRRYRLTGEAMDAIGLSKRRRVEAVLLWMIDSGEARLRKIEDKGSLFYSEDRSEAPDEHFSHIISKPVIKRGIESARSALENIASPAEPEDGNSRIERIEALLIELGAFTPLLSRDIRSYFSGEEFDEDLFGRGLRRILREMDEEEVLSKREASPSGGMEKTMGALKTRPLRRHMHHQKTHELSL